ncbi:intermembrane lipid transfer protein VPS13D-like [Oppia nitens]|uniref:intermembrane lipid transfer protein VPS13D-like n=1 Tax=Oppia nitens TaxID=1686743 RepID=UPI0023DA04A7|nr:intermembrane lipid transfer protein VPS13D-like [Oppia nitens]XP_054162796.1 intermembrane lipid transfer protein VPS13D-like [Oppia nitens]
MLSSLVAWVLNSYIGEYFDNVNTDQLSIALHNGEVELEGLPLRKDAFKHLGLPLEIINGYIGKISLKIPVYRLKSEPWVISIDELFLIGRPITDFNYNEEEETKSEQNIKINQLDATESRWKAIHESTKEESQSYYASSYISWRNYGSNFISNIVENVQLKIRSVHIRYEDCSTIPGIPFAAGIIIKSLSVHSTDENWIPKYVTRDNSEYLRKLLEMDGFSAYWDTNTQLFSHLDLPEMVKQMRNHLDRGCDIDGTPTDHEYILAPVCGKAYLKRNCSEKPLTSRLVPRTVIDLQLDQVPVLLTAIQYKHIIEWSSAFSRANTAWKYRKWKPKVAVNGNSKDWWKFAVDCIMSAYRERKRRRNWQFVLGRARDCVKYCDVYYNHLLHPETLTREMRLIKERIEYELSYEEICCLREIVFSNCDKSQQNIEIQTPSGNYLSLNYWFSGWYNYNTNDKTNTENNISSEQQNEETITANSFCETNSERRKSMSNLYNLNDIFVTRDAVFGQLNFTITNASFALMTFSENPSSPTFTSEKLMNNLMEFEFSNVKIGVEICNKSLCDYEFNTCTDITFRTQASDPLSNESNIQLNLLFECHYLNLVILRTKSAIIAENDASKLATASLNGCLITIKVASNEIGVDGHLNGLQVIDLVTDQTSNKHKRVINLGKEVTPSDVELEPKTFKMSLKDNTDNEKAFNFSFRRLLNENILKINIEMASLCYVHSSQLIYELTLCSQNIKKYMTTFSDKVKAAATEVALGMVAKTKSKSPNLRRTTTGFIEDFRLNVYLQTPVIILPISSSSYEVMVGHLGHISLKNHICPDYRNFKNRNNKNHIVSAEIRDLSLYSLDCSKNIKKGNHLMSLSVEELYSCKPNGISILQETVIEISVENKNITPKFEKCSEESGLNAVMAVSDMNATKFAVTSLSTTRHQMVTNRQISYQSVKELVLTFEIPNINLRVSYNDLLIYWQIISSLSYNPSKNSTEYHNDKHKLVTESNALPSSIKQLESLGFAYEDCVKALEICFGDISESAIWLTRNAKCKSDKFIDNSNNSSIERNLRLQNQPFYSNFSVIEIRIQNGTLCLIDDCNETDVPLLELNIKDFRLMQHNSEPLLEGFSQMAFSCDYFNSALSGWEPFIEDCKLQLSWNVIDRPFHIKTLDSHKKKISFHFELKEMLSINMTSHFIGLIKNVSHSWIQDIQDFMNLSPTKRAFRHRTPFIPYAIKNETGCRLRFYAIQDSHQSNVLCDQKMSDLLNETQTQMNWITVEKNQTIPFSFDLVTKTLKTRHYDSHMEKAHKIVVAVDGWKAVFPVTINRVGIYFREAMSEIFINQTARIVFSIELEPKSRKLVTIRSALLISNKTSNAIELKFQNTNESLYINSNAILPVPLRLVRNKIQVRPCDVGVNMCETTLNWEHVRRCNEISSELQICSPITVTRNQHSSYSTASAYRYCVLVERNRFPLDVTSQGLGLQSYRAQPAHTITLVPPLQITNLLPYELRFHISGTAVIGTIKSGEDISIHYVNPLEQITIEVSIENFPNCRPLVINPGAVRDYVTHIDLFDSRKRLLVLHALVSLVNGSTTALAVNIYSPFWIINKTGLPIIIKQEGASDFAGQLAEHEVARSICPLLFSFSEPDLVRQCSLRLGKTKGTNPRWSNPFYLEKGMCFRSLRVGQNDVQKFDKVCEFGIDIRNGRDRYRDTRIVTITPRYQIENLSSYRLEFAQKCMTISDSAERENPISILPKSNVSFHWPRTDKDRLLCVRIASIPDCHWSGGFVVEPSTSFHLNIRDDNRKSHFIRVEILTQSATFFIVLTDANNLPPPIRVENLSQVSIEFFQTNTKHSYMRTKVRANSQMPYAWDESTLKPHITVRAPGGSVSTYDLMSLAPGDQLTYENFVYLAFNATFNVEESDDEMVTVGPHFPKDDNNHQLVFDVMDGTNRVYLARKERGKRSQLWRLDKSKRLIHEGSSPPIDPNDPKKTSLYKTNRNELVLDIATECAQPGGYTQLMIRKIDAKRAWTQTWTFDESGRLCCEYPNLCVQPNEPNNGSNGLQIGNQIVLGPKKSDPTSLKFVSNEQSISAKKMRKGSGILTIAVLAEGPTRVLRISDSKCRDRVSTSNPPLKLEDINNEYKGFFKNIDLNVLFTIERVGLSIINNMNEELVHIFFRNSIICFNFNAEECDFNTSIKDIQIDNQLKGAEKAVILQLNSAVNSVQLPAISVSAQKQFVSNVEANVFKSFQISIKDMIFNLEEILLLKILEFLGIDIIDNELDQIHSQDSAANRAISSILAKSSRYYFTIFLIQLSQVKLSVFTSSHLPKLYARLKKRLGIKLIRFEDATVQLSPFKKVYTLMTKNFLIDSIYNHYRAELKSQAAKILGSVDFLGNPLGFVNDVTDGLNELIHEGNFGGLIWNVAHGISDSTAKVTSVLSDSLDVVNMDQRHQIIRKRIKQDNTNHLTTGFKGLGVGILGGFTSIITQTYEGAVKEGVPGIFVGLGKGLVGTITKPAVGMLDFATGAASAVRESTRKISNHNNFITERVRPPRVNSINGLLIKYDSIQAKGQEFFNYWHLITNREELERFVSVEKLRNMYSVLITTEKIIFIQTIAYNGIEDYKTETTIEFDNLEKCLVWSVGSAFVANCLDYYVVVIRSNCKSNDLQNTINISPKFLCENQKIANNVCHNINSVKHFHEERKYFITSS